MSNIATFEAAKLPSFIKPKAKVANAFASLLRNGFKVLSIKSKVFTVIDGENKKLVMSLDSDGNETDTPAANLEVVVVDVNPNKSRVYYKGGYEEGSSNKPDCSSNDNIAPAADAANPQAKKCAVCPHSQYGSRINEAGKKSFACSESMRLAVAPVGQLNDPMLLRVPPTSLKALGAFGRDVQLKGAEPHQVITRVGFDYTVSHPALTFKPLRYVTEDMYATIMETRESETVQFITGVKAMPQAEDAEADTESFVEPPKPEAKVAKPKPPVKQDDDDLPDTPKAKVNVEDDAPKKAKPAVPVESSADASIDDLEFDD